MKLTFVISTLLLLGVSSCVQKNARDETTIVSIQVIDRNGFAETVSTKDRLERYQAVDFLAAQPYQKVLRVYGKDTQGHAPSKVTSYHPNGYIWQYLEVVDGRAHGMYKEWYPNGQMRMELHVMEGVADISELAKGSWVFDGKNTIWDEDGHLIAEICYEDGMLHGPSLYYYPTGQLQKKISYFRDVVHGDIIGYDEQGQEVEVIPHEEGVRHGVAKGFWKTSEPMYEEKYEKDLLLTARYFSTEGTCISEIKEGNGYLAQFKEGALESLVEYKKGLPEGKVEQFDSHGFTHITYYQKEGKKEGEEIEFFPRSTEEDPIQPKISLHWHDDMLQGVVKTWFSTGTQESQKEMYQNKKNGAFIAWYKNGDIMLMEEYENDVLSKGSYYKKGDKKPISKIEKGKGIAMMYNTDGYFLKKISYEKGIPLLENEASY